MVMHYMAKNKKPYDIQSLKNLPIEEKIDKVIDILDQLQNKGFGESTKKYHKEMSKILED